MPVVIALLVAVSLLLLMMALQLILAPPAPRQGPPSWRAGLNSRIVRLGGALLDRLPDMRRDLEQRLVIAGKPMTPEEFLGTRLVGIGIGALVGVALGGSPLAVAGGVLGFIYPERWLASQIRQRQLRISQDLVQFVGLWRAAVEAGLDLMEAVKQITSQVEGPLAAEFVTAYRQVSLGYSLSVALYGLAGRCGVPELTSVISAICQADRYGTGVVEPLRQAEVYLLSQRSNQARARAAAKSMALRMPMVVIMLGMLILLLGPVFMSFATMF